MSHSTTRRQFVMVSVGLACALAAACAPARADRRPNVILCMGDDHAWA